MFSLIYRGDSGQGKIRCLLEGGTRVGAEREDKHRRRYGTDL